MQHRCAPREVQAHGVEHRCASPQSTRVLPLGEARTTRKKMKHIHASLQSTDVLHVKRRCPPKGEARVCTKREKKVDAQTCFKGGAHMCFTTKCKCAPTGGALV